MNSKPCTCHLPISHCVMHTCKRAQLDFIKDMIKVATLYNYPSHMQTLRAIEKTIMESMHDPEEKPASEGSFVFAPSKPREFSND